MPAPYPRHLPAYPNERYVVDRLFDFRQCRRVAGYTWGAITDGPASYDAAFDAVADNIDEVRRICDAQIGLRVTRIEAGRAQDVTADFVALFPEMLEAAE
jgi:hypothetical protein